MISIDLNCDMGEGMPNDAELMPYISSANIACGYHAGDEDTMRRTIELALKNNVSIGAHPSYLDKENFGRIDLVDIRIRPEELPEIIIEQLNSIQKICHEFGTKIHHVKPHGALYNRAAWDGVVAGFICTSILDFDEELMLYGLSRSEMRTEADAFNLRFVSEVFADRTYQDDGTLTPRSQPDALITDGDTSLRQVLQMIQQQTVTSVNNVAVGIKADTICIHGDGVHAVEFAKRIHEMLRGNNIIIKAL